MEQGCDQLRQQKQSRCYVHWREGSRRKAQAARQALPTQFCAVCAQPLGRKYATLKPRRCTACSKGGRARTCIVCGGTYRPTCGDQRTCGRICGRGLSKRLRRPHLQPARLCACGAELEKKHSYCGACAAARRDESRRRGWERSNAQQKLRRLEAPKPSKTAICAECGAPFAPRHGGHLYCRYACGKRAEKRRSPGYDKPRTPMAELLFRYGRLCWICGKAVDPARHWPDLMCPSIDHVIPRSAGGGDQVENLRPTHWHCNSRRGAGRSLEQLPLAV